MDTVLNLLTSDSAAGILDAAVGTVGGELVDWRVRQVDHRPGSSTTVAYRATVRRDGVTRTETLGASVGRSRDADKPGVITLSDGDTSVAVWRFPTDPGLPALARAFDPVAVENLLADLGVAARARSRPELTVRAYRPTRRAVIEARSASARAFFKVLRPSKVADLHRRHALLAGAGLPVPRPLGWSDDGLLVLSPLHGTPMRAALKDAVAIPSPQEVLDLLDLLPAEVSELPRRPAWSESAEHYAGVIGAALPAEAGRAADLARIIHERLAQRGPGTDPTHGDLYEGQIMLTKGRISGLLDVDSAGPGHRADDLACLVAHLDVLSLGAGAGAGGGTGNAVGQLPTSTESTTTRATRTPRTGSRTPQSTTGPSTSPAAYRTRMRELATEYATGFVTPRAGRGVDPYDLATRVAGVLLSLATGPHRVQERDWQAATSRRLDAVAAWLDGTRFAPSATGAG